MGYAHSITLVGLCSLSSQVVDGSHFSLAGLPLLFFCSVRCACAFLPKLLNTEVDLIYLFLLVFSYIHIEWCDVCDEQFGMKPHIFYRSDEPDAESESFTTHCVQCAFPEAYKDELQCFRFRINCIHFDQFMRRSVVDVSEPVVVVPLAEGNRVVRVDSSELSVVEEVPSSPFRSPVSLFLSRSS